MVIFDWLSPVRGVRRKVDPRWVSIRAKIKNDPYYRLQSMAEVAAAAELGVKIEVNQASVDDWLRLPGISIHQADGGGQFYCIEDLAATLNLPLPRLKPLEPLLNFSYYDPESLSTPKRVNPNTASLEELAQIPILETALAQAMVQNRLAHGNYGNLADLQQRLSLSSQLTSQLMHYLQF
ncbi:MAG: DNA uptake protein [Cyanobacteria bacterium SW_11_48_12]|nr:MAG: DNA uptake protein [Cyanobacteria bacterium SW_11_48_12]